MLIILSLISIGYAVAQNNSGDEKYQYPVYYVTPGIMAVTFVCIMLHELFLHIIDMIEIVTGPNIRINVSGEAERYPIVWISVFILVSSRCLRSVYV